MQPAREDRLKGGELVAFYSSYMQTFMSAPEYTGYCLFETVLHRCVTARLFLMFSSSTVARIDSSWFVMLEYREVQVLGLYSTWREIKEPVCKGLINGQNS